VDFRIVSAGYGLLESPRADARNVWFTDMALGESITWRQTAKAITGCPSAV
jgi:hypothetical protein